MKNFLPIALLMSLAINIPALAYTVSSHITPFQLLKELGAARSKTAILPIDVQPDFCQGGSLEVQDSGVDYQAKVIKATNALMNAKYLVVASQDFHPKDHMSFSSNNPGTKPFDVKEVEIPTADGGTKIIKQVMWPAHCIQGTPGAVVSVPHHKTIQKGTNPKVDSYSAFTDDGGQDTGLESYLRNRDVETLVVYGIATDYCVLYSVRDAIKKGFKVYVVLDLCRGVTDATSQTAIAEMKALGAVVVTKTVDARL